MEHRAGSVRETGGLAAVLATTILLVAAACEPSLAGSCSAAGPSSLPAPLVDELRSYRAAFRGPARLAADPAGNIYVSDPLAGRIVVREPSGRIASIVENLGSPLAIVYHAGTIFVGDAVEGSVGAYARNWRFLFWLGQGPGEFGFAGDIAVDPGTGNVWVTDTPHNRVKVYRPNGEFMRALGNSGSGEGQFASPMGIFIDPARSRAFIVDQGNARLQVFDLNGNYRSCIGSGGGGAGSFSVPQGVWGDGLGRLYVTDVFEGRVQILDGTGHFIDYVGDIGGGRGRLRIPGDLLIDPFGRLFVASTGSARLEVYGVDDYSDPESVIPADVEIRPDPLDLDHVTEIVAFIEVPGQRLDQILPHTIRANCVPTIPGSASLGDFDGDTVPDLRVSFDPEALAPTLGRKRTYVRITAVLGAMQIEGLDRIHIQTMAGSSEVWQQPGDSSLPPESISMTPDVVHKKCRALFSPRRLAKPRRP